MNIQSKNQWNSNTISRAGGIILLLLLLAIASGCSYFNGTRLEGLLGGDENLIKIAYTIADDLEQQAFPPLIPRHPNQPILTTTFVNNNDLKETSHFSRVLQEHLTSRYVQLGYTVREIKMRDELQIREKSGETILSRNLNLLQPSQKAQAVSVGTYSISNRIIYLSARLIDPVTSNIISSADYKVVMDRNIMAMFGLQLKNENLLDPVDEPHPSLMTRLLY